MGNYCLMVTDLLSGAMKNFGNRSGWGRGVMVVQHVNVINTTEL